MENTNNMNTQFTNTLELIKLAAKSPNLSEPGACQYVDLTGNHCIVGEVLSILGVSNKTLIDKGNTIDIENRSDLREFVESKGLSLDLLASAQKAFDEGSFNGWLEDEAGVYD